MRKLRRWCLRFGLVAAVVAAFLAGIQVNSGSVGYDEAEQVRAAAEARPAGERFARGERQRVSAAFLLLLYLAQAGKK